MRKLSAILITALLLSSFASMTVMADAPTGNYGNTGTIEMVYVDQNFDDASLGFDAMDNVNVVSGTYQPINVLNHATGLNMPWKTLVRDYKATSGYNHAKITAIGTNEDDSTNYALVTNRKGQIPFYLTIDTYQDDVATPSPVVEEGKLIYVDIRVKRVSISDDQVFLSLLDSANKEIFTIDYSSGKYPKLNANVSYGGEASTATPTVTYPYAESWVYLRAIIDFGTHTFQLYQGDTLDTLTPMVDGVTNFTFKNTAAANLYKIQSATKGALGFDDLKIYSVSASSKPVASDVTLEGKPNIGATLTATYGTYTDSTAEGESYGYWEAADNALFAGPVKISEDISIKAGETSEFVLTEAQKGKYVRFCVVPVNAGGTEGDIAPSNATSYAIGTTIFKIKTSGPIKNGNQFDKKYGVNSYPGVVEVVSTSDTAIEAILIAAWYQDGVITEVYSAPVSLAAATSTETGAIAETISTTAKDILSTDTTTGLELKVFLWDGYSKLTPLLNAVKYVSQF